MEPERQSPAMRDGQLSPAGTEAGSSGRPVRQRFRSSAHFQSVLDGLLSLRHTGILFDVVLLVEGRPIRAHRVLLAASCDYFRYAGCRVSLFQVKCHKKTFNLPKITQFILSILDVYDCSQFLNMPSDGLFYITPSCFVCLVVVVFSEGAAHLNAVLSVLAA